MTVSVGVPSHRATAGNDRQRGYVGHPAIVGNATRGIRQAAATGTTAREEVVMARRRRIADLTAGVAEAPSSIFGPDDDNVIPGEVIVALEADAAADVT